MISRLKGKICENKMKSEYSPILVDKGQQIAGDKTPATNVINILFE